MEKSLIAQMHESVLAAVIQNPLFSIFEHNYQYLIINLLLKNGFPVYISHPGGGGGRRNIPHRNKITLTDSGLKIERVISTETSGGKPDVRFSIQDNLFTMEVKSRSLYGTNSSLCGKAILKDFTNLLSQKADITTILMPKCMYNNTFQEVKSGPKSPVRDVLKHWYPDINRGIDKIEYQGKITQVSFNDEYVVATTYVSKSEYVIDPTN